MKTKEDRSKKREKFVESIGSLIWMTWFYQVPTYVWRRGRPKREIHGAFWRNIQDFKGDCAVNVWSFESGRRGSRLFFYVLLTVLLYIIALKNKLRHNLFLVYSINLYMFRAYLGPSSGGTTVCIQQLVIIILFRWLSVVLVGFSSKKNNKYQLLYTYGCTSWWWA